jgi:hypothetical protein
MLQPEISANVPTVLWFSVVFLSSYSTSKVLNLATTAPFRTVSVCWPLLAHFDAVCYEPVTVSLNKSVINEASNEVVIVLCGTTFDV